jgi:hypothetical protein
MCSCGYCVFECCCCCPPPPWCGCEDTSCAGELCLNATYYVESTNTAGGDKDYIMLTFGYCVVTALPDGKTDIDVIMLLIQNYYNACYVQYGFTDPNLVFKQDNPPSGYIEEFPAISAKNCYLSYPDLENYILLEGFFPFTPIEPCSNSTPYPTTELCDLIYYPPPP